MLYVRVLLLLSLSGVCFGAQPAATPPKVSPPTEANVEFAGPELERLDLFVGAWSVVESHFDPRGEVVATTKGTEEIVWVLDHRAIRRTYTTSGGTSTFRALGLLTWNAMEKKYQGTWYDNVSTLGPTGVKGEWVQDTKTLTLEIESLGSDGKPVRHRVVEKFEGLEKRTATTYRVDGTNLIKRLEVVYQRTTPCPARLRTIIGGR